MEHTPHEVVAIEAGDGLCWVRLTRLGDDWLLIGAGARDVSRAARKLRQIPAGVRSVPGGRALSLRVYLFLGALAAVVVCGL